LQILVAEAIHLEQYDRLPPSLQSLADEGHGVICGEELLGKEAGSRHVKGSWTFEGADHTHSGHLAADVGRIGRALVRRVDDSPVKRSIIFD
jgi:hypothetical protein